MRITPKNGAKKKIGAASEYRKMMNDSMMGMTKNEPLPLEQAAF